MKTTLFILLIITPFLCTAQNSVIKLSEDLELIPLNEHTYIHKSFINSEQFGRYSSNGLIYINKNEVLIADTPPSIQQSELLLKWISDQNLIVKAVVVNHHHQDALGGLEIFHQVNIPTFGFEKTSDLAVKNGFQAPKFTFTDSVSIKIGDTILKAFFFGEAHTVDNITLWIPSEQILFGGCIIKSLGSGKGNLEDANIEEWSNTVSRIKSYFPDIQSVIPGHGNHGAIELLDYTIEMFGE